VRGSFDFSLSNHKAPCLFWLLRTYVRTYRILPSRKTLRMKLQVYYILLVHNSALICFFNARTFSNNSGLISLIIFDGIYDPLTVY
jgi:hypothetical protein